MKICSTSLITREIHTKITVITPPHLHDLLNKVKINKQSTIPELWGQKCKRISKHFGKLSPLCLYCTLVILLPGILPAELATYSHQKTHTSVFLAALFVIVSKWKQSRCPPTVPPQCVSIMEYYTAVEKEWPPATPNTDEVHNLNAEQESDTRV